MKSITEMDLDEWEILPDDGFLEIHDDGGKKIYSRKYGRGPTSVLKTNYFVCPSKSSPQFVDTTTNQILPLPFNLEPTTLKPHDQEIPKPITPIPVEIKPEMIKETGSDQDPVSQVFFKKMKENEFVDMKVESPKSSRGGIMPQLDGTTFFHFEENEEPYNKVDALAMDCGSKVDADSESEMEMDENNWGVNIWKWSLTGIGAICSFGVAAATVCIIVLGSRRKANHHHQNEKLQFHQIYTNDKRIKQVVQHASKLNEAMTAVRGVPLTRAHITLGGYYEAI